MNIETQGQAIEIMNNAIPLPKQIKDIDLSHPDCIYFTWRSNRYKLELYACSVWVVDGAMLRGDDASILMSDLLKREAIKC